MPINIHISGANAEEAMQELRDFSAPFHVKPAADIYMVAASKIAASVEPAPADAPTSVQPASSVDAPAAAAPKFDKDGFPWDERIHSSNRAFNADGTWRRRRGVSDDLVKKVEAELYDSGNKAPAKQDTAEQPAEEVEQPAQVVEDSPEDQDKDAEDEKAEADAVREERIAKEPEKVLTHDDVRAALGEYVKKFGMDAAQQDGPRILAAVLTGDVNATNDGKPFKVSDVPDDQAVLKKAVDGIHEAMTKNVFKR